MALTRSTLSAAVAINDTSITVASATDFTAGDLIRIDQEYMQVQQSYVSGTVIPVLRGRLMSAGAAHVITAGVIVGTQADDFDAPGAGVPGNSPIGGRARYIRSITADNSTVTLQQAGSDQVLILNGTAVINLTVPIPTSDMDGDILVIIGNGIAAHVVTVTGGVGGVGATADVYTFSATQKQAIQLMAANITWQALGPLATATANVSGPSLA